jgi:hypothetical protein
MPVIWGTGIFFSFFNFKIRIRKNQKPIKTFKILFYANYPNHIQKMVSKS